MGEMDAYKDLFLSESADYLQAITDGLLALEEHPHDFENVEMIFRGAHSLKGMAAAMGYEKTADLTHRMEELMDLVRKGLCKVDAKLIDLMFEALDAVKIVIGEESGGATETSDFGEVMGRIADMLKRLQDAPGDGAAVDDPESGNKAPVISQSTTALGDAKETDRTSTPYSVVVTLEEDCILKAVRAYMVIKRLNHMGRVIDTVPSARDIEDERFDHDFTVVVLTSGSPSEIVKAVTAVTEVASAQVTEVVGDPRDIASGTVAKSDDSASARRRKDTKAFETQTVRISIGYLDSLVDLVGELITFRSSLERIADSAKLDQLDEAVEDLRRISTELRYVVMDTRMVPVENIFNRFPRMVRDLARSLGKEVVFRMEGLGIELDRTVLDEIGDPIVHLLRNCLDHGIESPDHRSAVGKPRKGTVALSASRERDTVRIVISDDGAGIDANRIWDKACSSGIVDPHDRDMYDTDDVLMLICSPGFSTVEQPTRVSGRGVGLDAVKGKIEHLGGSLSIYSQVGEGSRFELTLPLTLAIVQVVLVSTGQHTFALPLGFVDEILGSEGLNIDSVDQSPVLVYREGEVVPLYRLDEIMGIVPGRTKVVNPREQVILMQCADGMKRGLVVEGLEGRIEAVVKPLSSIFRATKGFSGTTVLGDARVALILDPRTLFS